METIGDNAMKNPFDYFDKIYCINLDSRADRWEQVQTEFEKIGIENKVIRVPAYYISNQGKKFMDFYDGKNKIHIPYHVGGHARFVRGASYDMSNAFACSLSHYKCFQDAKENNYKKYLVFEDDVCFENYNSKLFSTALSELPTDWEAFLLGCNDWNCSRVKSISDNIEKRNGFGCTHAIAINSNLYEKFEKEFNKRVIDANTTRKRWWKRTDYFYSQITSRLYSLKNPFAFQNDSKSDIR
tara:strand:- start:3881 stop:4603 length:723 start_codon:yes stop_codon:yes gene_type:complete